MIEIMLHVQFHLRNMSRLFICTNKVTPSAIHEHRPHRKGIF